MASKGRVERRARWWRINSHTTKTTEQILLGRKLTKGMGEEVKKEKEGVPWK